MRAARAAKTWVEKKIDDERFGSRKAGEMNNDDEGKKDAPGRRDADPRQRR